MGISDRIRRQLFDGVNFTPQSEIIDTPSHLYMDSDQQLRMGLDSGVGVVPNVVAPQDSQVPLYDATLKLWKATAISKANVLSGSFLADDWTVDGDIASFTISHTLSTQSVDVTVFDISSGTPTETYVEVQPINNGTVKLNVAASATFPGIFLLTSITGVGAVGSFGGSTAVLITTMGNVFGATTINWGPTRFASVILTGETVLSLSDLGSTVCDKVVVKVSQDATGGRYLYWGSNVAWPNGYQPEGSLTANATDYFEFLWDGSIYTCTNLIQNAS